MAKKSIVWKYFYVFDHDTEHVKCIKCGKVIGCAGKTTLAMINHLKTHGVAIKKDQNHVNVDDKMSNTVDIRRFTKMETIGGILARIAAVDGMSITAMAKSKALKDYLRLKGMVSPQSRTTISSYIYDFYIEKKNETRMKFQEYLKNNIRFSITVDEWTDCRLKRYLNVTVHVLDDDLKTCRLYVLGLIEITGVGSSDKLVSLVKQMLKEYDVDVERDVIASTHDGAAVMKKYGRDLGICSQLRHNHGLHLAVVDVIFI
jgi:galactitol-specific phosphotransferase system IIB component